MLPPEKNRWAGVSFGKLLVAACASFYFLHYLQDSRDWHFLDNVNLIMHEAGHAIFFFLGEFVQILSGSVFQVLVPLVFAAYFFFKKNFFAGSLVMFWVGQSIINVSIYMADSVVMELPLLGGESSIHDWNYILSSLNMMERAEALSSFLYGTGALVIFLALISSLISARKDKML